MTLALQDMGVALYLVVVMVILFIGSAIAYKKDNSNGKGE